LRIRGKRKSEIKFPLFPFWAFTEKYHSLRFNKNISTHFFEMIFDGQVVLVVSTLIAALVVGQVEVGLLSALLQLLHNAQFRLQTLHRALEIVQQVLILQLHLGHVRPFQFFVKIVEKKHLFFNEQSLL
jgi:hypothetical protein